jgi:hypothetical protein
MSDSFNRWQVPIICLNISLIGLMLGSVFAPNWISSFNHFYAYDPNDIFSMSMLFFNGRTFKGSLWSCQDSTSCSGNYFDLKNSWCQKYNMYWGSNVLPTNTQLDFKSACEIFTDLQNSMILFAICEAIAVLSIAICSILLVPGFRNKILYRAMFCLYSLACVSHLVGTVYYIIINNVSFGGDCESKPQNGGNQDLCANIGIILAMILTFTAPIFSIICCVILIKKLKPQEFRRYDAPEQIDHNDNSIRAKGIASGYNTC